MDPIRPPSRRRNPLTLFWCAYGLAFVVWLAVVGTLGYVAYHFISKWW